MKRIAVLTSGGDAPGMNAAIRAVVRTAIFYDVEIYGIYQGYAGLIEREIRRMDILSVDDIIHRGGTILDSSRSKYFMTRRGKEEAKKALEEFGIDALIVIGGDGSYRGALELSAMGVEVMCIPGTIDNDVSSTDYTIGFDTAVNTAVDAISKISDTSAAHNRGNVVQVMGRDTGYIALYAGIAGGAESVMLPEIEADLDGIYKKMLASKNMGKMHSISVVAEGAGEYMQIADDMFKHTGIETKGTNLGYIQRGGSPSAFDRILASVMGAMAVELILKGQTNRALSFKDGKYTHFDLSEAIKMKKELDSELYRIMNMISM